MNARTYDVVVIGSGAGGGTVAEGLGPLARAGYRILVVEQGARLRDDEFTGRNPRWPTPSTRTAAGS